MNLVLQMKEGGNGGYDEMIAYINKMRAGGGGRPNARRPERPAAAAGERKCPNCGKVHPPGTRTCPSPQVPVADRPCWFCQTIGHNSQNCPKRKAAMANGKPGAMGAAIKALAIEDQQVGQVCFAVTEQPDPSGYHKVKNGSRPRPRPMSVNDFIQPAKFFNDSDESTSKCPTILTSTKVNREVGPGHPLNKEPRNMDDVDKKPKKKIIEVPKEKNVNDMTLAEFEELLNEDQAAAEALVAKEHTEAQQTGLCGDFQPVQGDHLLKLPENDVARQEGLHGDFQPVQGDHLPQSHVSATTESPKPLDMPLDDSVREAHHECECCSRPRQDEEYVYEEDVSTDGPDTQWEILKHASVPGYKPVDWHRMSAEQQAQAVFLGLRAHQREQAERLQRERHQAECARLGVEFPSPLSQAHTVSCLTSLTTAKQHRILEELEEQAWMQFSKTASQAHGIAVDDATLEELIDSDVNCVIPDDGDDSYIQEVIKAAVIHERKIKVAIDSGSVDNVVHPDDLPDNIHVEPNAPGTKHFKGANDSHIERFGQISTILKQEGKAPIRGDWVGADVSRALHSVSKVCGPPVAPKQDVLFNAGKCYVVAPGIVDEIMKYVQAVAEYDRDGGLYTAEMTVSGFARPGAAA